MTRPQRVEKQYKCEKQNLSHPKTDSSIYFEILPRALEPVYFACTDNGLICHMHLHGLVHGPSNDDLRDLDVLSTEIHAVASKDSEVAKF
jgi:hypothetical protein